MLKPIMRVYLWVGMCSWVQVLRRPEEGTRFAGAATTGGCKLPDAGAGNQIATPQL